jgi:hypothetical protein
MNVPERMQENVAGDLVSVQPMESDNAEIFKLETVYDRIDGGEIP